jgi:molybdopterin-guanine dinucleotide biosynthesis protein A
MNPPVPNRRAPSCTGAILAGGNASRFGGLPKGLAEVGGVRIIDRVANALRESCDDLILIANDPAAVSWLPGVVTKGDIFVGAAGLGGIHAALAHSGTAVIVVAWDMPFVPPGLLMDLRAGGAAADAVLPASGSKRGVEPLCAYYSQGCLDPIERALRQGDRRPIAFHADVRLTVLSQAEVSQHGDNNVIFMNVNTAEDLITAEQLARTLSVAKDNS